MHHLAAVVSTLCLWLSFFLSVCEYKEACTAVWVTHITDALPQQWFLSNKGISCLVDTQPYMCIHRQSCISGNNTLYEVAIWCLSDSCGSQVSQFSSYEDFFCWCVNKVLVYCWHLTPSFQLFFLICLVMTQGWGQTLLWRIHKKEKCSKIQRACLGPLCLTWQMNKFSPTSE